MEGLGKKLSNLGIHDFRNAARFAQNMIVQYEPYQIDVRRATNTDSWGPTPKHLAKIMRNRFQVPMYLITEYTLKRLVDHMAKRPKNLYEKARKQYVNYGNEWRVILKCLIVLEFLLLNVESLQELEQVKKCLKQHIHIFKNQISNYKIDISQDGKMEIHERGIYKKNENILQLLDDSTYLKQERSRVKKNSLKMLNILKNESGLGGVSSSSSSSASASAYQNDVYGSYDDSDMDIGNGKSGNNRDDDDDDDDSNEQGKYPDTEDYYVNNIPTYSSSEQRKPTRQKSIVDEQRIKRREILKNMIEKSKQEKEDQINAQKHQEPIVDLLDFDSPVAAPAAPAAKATPMPQSHNVWADEGGENEDDDDDEFGDFQSDFATPSSGSAASKPASSSASTTIFQNNNSAPEPASNDMFADLLSFSKTNF